MKKQFFVLTAGILAAGSLASLMVQNLGGTMGVGALQNLLFNASSQGFNILGIHRNL